MTGSHNDALGGAWEGCLRGEPICRRPVLPGSAPPRRPAVRCRVPKRPRYVQVWDSTNRITFVHSSDESFRTVVHNARGGKRGGRLLGGLSSRRPVLRRPAPSRRWYVRALGSTVWFIQDLVCSCFRRKVQAAFLRELKVEMFDRPTGAPPPIRIAPPLPVVYQSFGFHKFPGHALHEKGLQRQISVGTLVNSQQRRALAVPVINR